MMDDGFRGTVYCTHATYDLCALMLREVMWSMVSEIHLNVPGVDYPLYTGECLVALQDELDVYQSLYGKLT